MLQQAALYTVSQKTIHLTVDYNFSNVNWFTKFFHYQIPEEILHTYTSHRFSTAP